MTAAAQAAIHLPDRGEQNRVLEGAGGHCPGTWVPGPPDDRRPPEGKQVLGWTPIVEPLLAPVFHEPDRRRKLTELGSNVYLPSPGSLIATKIGHLEERAGGKALKDLYDICALVAYGGADTNTLVQEIHEVLPHVLRRIQLAIGYELLSQTCDHLEVGAQDFRAVAGPLAVHRAR